MKNKIPFAAFAVSAFLVISFVINNEKNKQTPYERFTETSETTERKEFEPMVVYNSDHTVKYEILSYDLIDDRDIANQTKYDGKYFLEVSAEYANEYFLENHLPNPDYLIKDVDYAAMKRDYPLYAEYSESCGKKGMTNAEAEEFLEKHEDKYATVFHPKTKYLFLHCRVTNVSNKKVLEPLYDNNIIAMRGNRRVSLIAGDFCYYDGPRYSDVYPGKYTFERNSEPLECVIGWQLWEYLDRIDLSEPNIYYFGNNPKGLENDYSFIPAGYDGYVVINDTPE